MYMIMFWCGVEIWGKEWLIVGFIMGYLYMIYCDVDFNLNYLCKYFVQLFVFVEKFLFIWEIDVFD